ncbi:hypothetical protein [Paenibacillus harenae]|nr:hypothetical protein [Paenibacillus harenae]
MKQRYSRAWQLAAIFLDAAALPPSVCFWNERWAARLFVMQ